MLAYRIYNKNILINLNNGLYRFAPLSSTGKTYMYTLLESLARQDNGIYVMTYTGNEEGKKTELFKHQRNVVMMDRFDLYSDLFTSDELSMLGKDSIVLFDFKCYSTSYLIKFGLCNISLTEQRIEVKER